MINRGRLLALAELLRQVESENPSAFNMDTWGASLRYAIRSQGQQFTVASCDTAGCIAGWAAALAHLDPDYEATSTHTQDTAIAYLDLPDELHYRLFTPAGCQYSAIRAGMAADVVEKLAETGKVEWPWQGGGR